MLYLLTDSKNIKEFWINNFKKMYGVEIIEDKSSWHDKIKVTNKDIFILDVDIFKDTSEVIQYFDKIKNKIKTIAIVEEPKLAHGTLLIRKGFKSYLGKKTPKIIVEQALNSVIEGNVWVYPELMSFIIKMITSDSKEFNDEVLEKLTPKEQEVAKYVAKGYSNKEIAKELDVQLITVKKHLSSIFEKLNIKDRVALAILLNKK